MIKFFHNIRKNLVSGKSSFERTSNYIKYALGEIVLVVIGILIALQINTWNGERKERVEEQKILKIIKADFEYNKSELERNKRKSQRLIVVTDSLLFLFNAPQEIADRVNIDMLIRRLSGYSTFDPSDGALNNLIGSGKLDIIKNDSLRVRLTKWFGKVQDVKEDEKRMMEFGDRYLNPVRLKNLILNPESKFIVNSKLLFNDYNFENVVYSMRGFANYILNTNYKMLETEIDETLLLVNQEIKE